MKSKIFCLPQALALVISVTAAPAMAAGDWKTFPGSMCQPEDRVDVENLSHWLNGTQNTSNSDLWVYCPILRDNVRNKTGTVGANITVKSAEGRKLKCTFETYTWDNKKKTVRSEITYSKVVKKLNVDINSGEDNGSYGIFCILPPGGSIIQYQIGEYE